METMAHSNDAAKSKTQDSPVGRSIGDGRSTSSEARSKAEDTTRSAARKAEEQASRQKERAADRLGRMSDALRSTSDTLREEQEDAVAGYVETAADQVARFSGYLRDREVGQLLDEARGFARRDPALFLGGAALLGMLGARFMRSSNRDTDMDSYGYDDEY